MKFKRFMALALAGVMTLAMTGNAFAETMERPKDISDETSVEIVEKVIQANSGVKLRENEKFSFLFEDEGSTTPLTTVPTLSVEFKKDTAGTAVQDKDYDEWTAKASIDPSVFDTVGVYKYKITEAALNENDNPDKDYWTPEADKAYHLVVWVYNETNKDTGAVTKKKEYKIYETDENTKLDTATFTNIYKPVTTSADNGALNLKKIVTDGQWAKTDTYNFKITFTGTSLTPLSEYKIDPEYTGVSLKDQGTWKLDNIPEGISYTIEELEATKDKMGDMYEGCVISVNGAAGNLIKPEENKTTNGKIAATSTMVEFTNKFTAGITPTGLAISVAPFIAMFAAVAGAIALYVAAKRRVR